MSAAHDHVPAEFNRAFAIGIALNLAFVAMRASQNMTPVMVCPSVLR